MTEVVDAERKAGTEESFRFFCQAYFPQTFYLSWSEDHLKVIARIEQAVLHGGLFALAMPRGSSKSSLCERACIWAILYGHRRFVRLIGSGEGHAVNRLDTIKTELESNDLLLEDFPEAIHPVRCLEGIANRCAGQLCNGERTHIEWTAKEIVLPTIPASKASGPILKVAGITGRIRGMKHQTAGGESFRPDLVILDDPQTDESAKSLSQCQARESILAGAVLGLAGPGRKISGIMPCTVIKPDDMADRILLALRRNWAADEPCAWLVGTTLCLSCLLEAERYDELHDVLSLQSRPFWHYDKLWAEALARQGRTDEAIAHAESMMRDDRYDRLDILRFCERVLLEAGMREEAYRRYGLRTSWARTYLQVFRETAARYPERDTRQVLLDLIEERGDRGKWFAAAKDAGHFDIALEWAATGTTEPKTLIRAARDFAESQPEFAARVALQAVEGLLEGWGYEPDTRDIAEAHDYLMQAAGNCNAIEWAHVAVEELPARRTGQDSIMRKALIAHLERSSRDRLPGDSSL